MNAKRTAMIHTTDMLHVQLSKYYVYAHAQALYNCSPVWEFGNVNLF